MEYHKINIFLSGKTQAGIGLPGRSCAHVALLASLHLAISPPPQSARGRPARGDML